MGPLDCTISVSNIHEGEEYSQALVAEAAEVTATSACHGVVFGGQLMTDIAPLDPDHRLHIMNIEAPISSSPSPSSSASNLVKLQTDQVGQVAEDVIVEPLALCQPSPEYCKSYTRQTQHAIHQPHPPYQHQHSHQYQHQHHFAHPQPHQHELALGNFCLLLLDADWV
jgi:hypothetical protein